MALTTVKSDQIQTSVALAGSPTTTTQSASDNSTKVATTAYVETAVANLVASAPAALNTLDELAAALNDDASFSTTVTNSIATKLPLAGGTLTGALTVTGDANPALEISRGSANTTNVNLKYNTTLTGQISAANEKFQISAAGSGTEMEFYTAGVKALEIDTSGNVSIGTVNTARKLNIKSGSRNASSFAIEDASSTAEFVRIGQQSDGDGFFQLRTVAGAGNVLFDASGDSYITGGNVGIGTASPATGTHTSYQNLVVGETTSSTSGLSFKASTTGNSAIFFSDGASPFNRGQVLYNHDGDYLAFSAAGSEALRISSNGDILFGGITDKNVFNNTSGTGTSINNSAGEVQIANNNDTCLYLNRMGNNGALVSLRQAGVNYGTIGIYGGAPYIGHASGGFMFNGVNVEPTQGVSRINNTVNLGSSTYRFKDLHLAGGVYVGGTGTSNKLDDYEEGNWTPTIQGNSGATGQSYAIQNGKFTKIGSFVHYTFDVQLSTLGTLSGTYVVIGGLPFAGTGSNLGGTANIGYHNVGGYAQPLGAYISGSNVYLMEHGNAGTDYLTIGENKITNSSRIIGSLIVHTPS
jgi:hypothetical protein